MPVLLRVSMYTVLGVRLSAPQMERSECQDRMSGDKLCELVFHAEYGSQGQTSALPHFQGLIHSEDLPRCENSPQFFPRPFSTLPLWA